eukprot:COSAG01_NODE_5467_length_4243_cov_50.334701_4_plen_468_part_00
MRHWLTGLLLIFAVRQNSGWIFDPTTSDYGWVVKKRNNMPRCGGPKNMGPGNCEGSGVREFPAAQGDLIKFRINGTDGDWVMEASYAGICTIFLLGNWCPEGECNTCGRPHMVDLNGTRYLAFTDRDKSLFKWNQTTEKFVPCAGIVKSFVNVTNVNLGSGEGNGPGYDKIYYTWHDSNNDGTWMLSTRAGKVPDLQELAIVTTPDSRGGGNWSCECVVCSLWLHTCLANTCSVTDNYFTDLMQDDFSFTGVAESGYWQWRVIGMDSHENPIYDPQGPVLLFNDSVVLARAEFNASTDQPTCPKCQGLPATHGGNEVTARLRGSRTSSRFVDSSHRSVVASMGATGSQFFKGGCFSADACPQWKLAWYDKNESAPGGWTNKWRIGRTSIGGDTGVFQFNKGTRPKEGQGIEPMTVHPVIGNVIAVTDQMMAGLLLFTTDGLYIDTLGIAPGGAPGYRKNFDFGSKNV